VELRPLRGLARLRLDIRDPQLGKLARERPRALFGVFSARGRSPAPVGDALLSALLAAAFGDRRRACAGVVLGDPTDRPRDRVLQPNSQRRFRAASEAVGGAGGAMLLVRHLNELQKLIPMTESSHSEPTTSARPSHYTEPSRVHESQRLAIPGE
jgi:hypothetical protein